MVHQPINLPHYGLTPPKSDRLLEPRRRELAEPHHGATNEVSEKTRTVQFELAGAGFLFGKEDYLAISSNTQHDSPYSLTGWEFEYDGNESPSVPPHRL